MYWSMCRGSSVSIRLLVVLKLQNIAFLSIVFEGVFLDGKTTLCQGKILWMKNSCFYEISLTLVTKICSPWSYKLRKLCIFCKICIITLSQRISQFEVHYYFLWHDVSVCFIRKPIRDVPPLNSPVFLWFLHLLHMT